MNAGFGLYVKKFPQLALASVIAVWAVLLSRIEEKSKLKVGWVKAKDDLEVVRGIVCVIGVDVVFVVDVVLITAANPTYWI